MAVDARNRRFRLVASNLSAPKRFPHRGGSPFVRSAAVEACSGQAFLKVQVPVSSAPAGGESLRVPLPHSYWLFLRIGWGSTAPPVLAVPLPANSEIDTLSATRWATGAVRSTVTVRVLKSTEPVGSSVPVVPDGLLIAPLTLPP